MLTLYGIPNCDKCRAARKWLTSHGIEHRFHDVRRDGLNADLVARWQSQLGDKLVDDVAIPLTDHELRWLLYLRCPFIHSSICMRRQTIMDSGIRYRQEFHYAEDFEIYHQLAKVGKIACLPDRLTVYREQTEPLVDFYREAGLLKVVAGEGDIDAIYAQLKSTLGLD